jgi:Ig-like domain from next to BRCA1 gene/PA14 domain
MLKMTARPLAIALILSLLIPLGMPIAASAACSDQAAFVSDVTIPDYTKMSPGVSFDKTWRLKNAGTCIWTTSYKFYFSKGDQMGAPGSTSLPKSVKPGETVDLKLTLKTPSSAGTYQGNFMLKNAQGQTFGINGYPFWVLIVVTSSSSSSSSGSGPWKGEYYDSRDLSGRAEMTQYSQNVDFDWGSKSPNASFPPNSFSIRWTRKMSFNAGTYRFRVLAGSGARLYVDGVLVLDAWHQTAVTQHSVDLDLTKGTHRVVLEYYHRTGRARVYLKINRVT